MPKIVDHDQYRKQLLTKSLDLFASKGYGSITMREIARGIGVSTGTLYHYFSSKETLFLQLVEELTEQDIINFLAFSAKTNDVQTLLERIETLFAFVAHNEDYFLKQTLIWIDFCRQQNNAESLTREVLKRSDERVKQVISDRLKIPEKVAEFIFIFFHGLLLAKLFEGKTISYPEQGILLAKMLTAYLEPESQLTQPGKNKNNESSLL
ncbi:TetR/AcrR family transcriptional regulator [Pleurocapsales cyanobacterium LEGE 06147]|nr:TetR/AcrR family transcriptional regulator [Pleurocapsales cyanobacterium LEGE 06147]